MPRRAPYTKVVKTGQERPAYVRGKGDALHRRFQCLSPACEQTIVVSDAICGSGFDIACPSCGYRHVDGGSEQFFTAEVVETATGDVLAEAAFAPNHADYLAIAERVKYCVLCYSLLPLDAFDQHSARATGRQSECRMCKGLYNGMKNGTRLIEQHREAADNRRLLRELSWERASGFTVADLLQTFENRCFNCRRVLAPTPGGEDGYYLDHTLPVAWLWPLEHGPTILCRRCNGRKADKWPRIFYRGPQLRALAARTGIPHAVLAGQPYFNDDALARLRAHSAEVIERWAEHPERLRVLRRRIQAATGEDVFASAPLAARRSAGLIDD